jgi:FimV-like protein
VLDRRETVVEAGKNLINLWSLKEVRKALAGPNPSERENSDPRVAYLVEEHLPNILPPSYKAGILAKLDQAHEAFEARGDIDTARELLDEVIEEAQILRDNKITAESADAFITSAKEARRHIEDEAAKQRS